jgi:hypothetical protein
MRRSPMPKLVKKVAIARSGVYKYSAGALAGLGLSLPPEKKGQKSFGVFRPPEVLKRNSDKFSRLPLTLEHPPKLIDGNDFKSYVQGFTGDTVWVEDLGQNNVMLKSTVAIMDNEAISAYYRGIVEVSPGYKGNFVWDSGVSPDGEAYDIVMKDITEVNHLALTREGRGGPTACVFDSREALVKPRKSAILYAIKKRLAGVKDAETTEFVPILSNLIDKRLKMSDDDIGKSVASLLDIAEYLPDSDDKSKLVSFTEDLVGIGEEGDEAAKEMGLIIGNLFHTLDTSAMEQVSIVMDAYDEKAPEEKKPDEAHEASESPEEEKKEEHEKGETPEEEAAEEENKEGEEEVGQPTALDEPSATLDDSIFDKKEDELTPEEKCYLHSALMEMLKEHLISKKIPEEAPPGEQPAEEKPGEEAPVEEKPEAEAEEEPKHEEVAEEKKDEKKAVMDSSEARYPIAEIPLTASETERKGVSTDDVFMKLKRGR